MFAIALISTLAITFAFIPFAYCSMVLKSRDCNIIVVLLCAVGMIWIFSSISLAIGGEYNRAMLDAATAIPSFCAGWIWREASKFMSEVEKAR